MAYLMIILRLIHILGGVFWVGGGMLNYFFLIPAMRASGETGQKYMGQLMSTTRLSSIMSAASGSSILAGFILYWIDSDGFTSAWLGSGPGIGFGLGGAFALVGFIFGLMIGRANGEMAALAREIKGQPTPAQASRMAAIQSRLGQVAPISTWCLILATVLMATARYFSF